MQPDARPVRRVAMSIVRTSVALAALAVAASLPVARSAPVAVASVALGEPVAARGGREGSRPAPVVRPVRSVPRARVAPRPAPRARAVARPTPLSPTPWFATPEAAMRYLVVAYNEHQDLLLRQVTTPVARENLIAMRGYAPALRLKTCTRVESGAYDCTFWHSLAKPEPGHDGHALFRVAPAAKYGWYMTILAGCGDG